MNWSFDEDSFERVTTEAKDFIKKCLLRVPEYVNFRHLSAAKPGAFEALAFLNWNGVI